MKEDEAGRLRHAVERLRSHAKGYEAKGRDDLAAELRRVAASMAQSVTAKTL